MGIAAIIAAQQQQEEEEKHPTPVGKEPDQYEYKILRALFPSRYSDPAQMQRVLAEEAAAGWELHEKLDNFRIRLRRPIACREQDTLRTEDPYRSIVKGDIPRMRTILWIALAVILLLSVLLTVVTTLR